MEKKPNITPTPWSQGTRYMTRSITGRNENGNILVTKGRIDDKQWKIDSEAIVTAVNCTYGAGLNPEKIQELIDRVELFLENTTAEKLNQIFTDYEQKNYLAPMLKALNNIKYKDEIEPIKLKPGMEGPFPKENKY